MKRVVFTIVLLAAASLGAQEARVIALKSDEVTEVRDAYESLQRAQKRWAEVQERIRRAHTLKAGQPECNGQSGFTVCQGIDTTRPGWEYGFEFSDDFKYIVPKKWQATATGTSTFGWNGCYTTVPVTQ